MFNISYNLSISVGKPIANDVEFIESTVCSDIAAASKVNSTNKWINIDQWITQNIIFLS